MSHPNEHTSYDFVQLESDGLLESFIDDLEALMAKQREMIERFKNRQILAPILHGLQNKVDLWNTQIETARAFKNKNRFEVSKSSA